MTTEIGEQVGFKFELIPSDMKWMSSHLRELNNCATYFPPFANVNQTHKGAMVLLVALEQLVTIAVNLENGHRRESTKVRGKIGQIKKSYYKFIAQNKLRQEFVPLSGKYVDLLRAEPLHSTNNAWQNWFSAALSVVMQYTNQSHLKAETIVSDLPDSSPLLAVLKCLKDKVTYGRLHKAFLRWFTEKQKKSITFSYGFTRLESKYFCWHFASLI